MIALTEIQDQLDRKDYERGESLNEDDLDEFSEEYTPRPTAERITRKPSEHLCFTFRHY